MSNKSLVLNYLKQGNSLTAMDGFNLFNIVSVRDYISQLRAEGLPIVSEWCWNADFSKRYKEYWMSDLDK